MRILCKCLGGSRSYGLETPESDFDYRLIGAHTEIHNVIGLGRYEHQQDKADGKDKEIKEFRHAMSLLKGSNSQIVELMFNENWIELTPEWQLVIDNRNRLVDSEKLFNCIRGYMQGEYRAAFGEGKFGKLGSKRKEALDRLGFSPKNAVQMYRLAWAAGVYFSQGYFPVNIMKENRTFGMNLLSIKTQPEIHNIEKLKEMAKIAEEKLIKDYENRAATTKFSDELADNLILSVYGQTIKDAYNQL